MKYNRIILICSAISAVLSLTLYSVFGYVECVQNEYVADISLAVLGSAVLLIVSSWVGYMVEKNNLRENILSISDDYHFAIEMISEIENGRLTTQSLSRLTNNSYKNLFHLYNKLRSYYIGLFIKDKKLEELFYFTLRTYAEHLMAFEVDLSNPSITGKEITKKFNKLLIEEKNVSTKMDEWMKFAKFKLGEPFEIKETEETQDI